MLSLRSDERAAAVARAFNQPLLIAAVLTVPATILELTDIRDP